MTVMVIKSNQKIIHAIMFLRFFDPKVNVAKHERRAEQEAERRC